MHLVAAVRLPRGTCIGRHAAACRAPRHGLFWRTMMNKRAGSAHDVGLHGAPSTGLSRVSSQYDSIPMDVQNRLQSMGWRIRSSTYALLTRRCESWIQTWRLVQRRVSARYRTAGQAVIASVGPHGICAAWRATWHGAAYAHRRRRRSAVALLPQARHGRGRLHPPRRLTPRPLRGRPCRPTAAGIAAPPPMQVFLEMTTECCS